MSYRPKDFFESEGENFMTPHVLRYGWIEEKKVAYELSTGTGFTFNSLFGVTIRPDKNKQSNCFDSKREAESYIEELQDS